MNFKFETCHGIIEIETNNSGNGDIKSDLEKFDTDGYNLTDLSWQEYNGALDGIEALLLAMACEGILANIPEKKMTATIDTAINACSNNIL